MRPLLLTSDGELFVWPHSDARTTVLTLKQLEALLSRSALDRVMAHRLEFLDSEERRRGVLRVLFGTVGKRHRAYELHRCAQRIDASGLRPICGGLAEKPLVRIFRATADRRELKRLILAEPVPELHDDRDTDPREDRP